MTVESPATELISAPGVYALTPEAYHADPVAGGSLSSTGARRLLPPSCPALFREWLDAAPQDRMPRRHLDYGTAAHHIVLGVGQRLGVVEADDWRKKTAQEARKSARMDGRIPLLRSEYDRITEMAERLRRHTMAGRLLDADHGTPEQTLVARDPETGVWMRAMVDWQIRARDGRLLLVDYKTCDSAEPDAFARSMARFGYYQQGDWYVTVARLLQLADDIAFMLIAQEKTAPYLVTVAQLPLDALHWGAVKNRKARHLYRQCTESGHWPSYSDQIISLELPRNHQFQLNDQLIAGVFDVDA